jgi:hypothetical protein
MSRNRVQVESAITESIRVGLEVDFSAVPVVASILEYNPVDAWKLDRSLTTHVSLSAL